MLSPCSRKFAIIIYISQPHLMRRIQASYELYELHAIITTSSNLFDREEKHPVLNNR